MNLDMNPTVDQLRDLLRQCNDTAGHHVLWVKKSGNVEISIIPESESSAEFQEAHPDMQLRLETFQAGNEYVGPDAANDEEWIAELFERLRKEWRQAKGKSGVAHVIRL